MDDLDQHLAAIQAGDPDAFGRWVAGAEPGLRLSLRSFAATVDTEAVLQEALLRVWQVAPRLSPDGRPNTCFRLALRVARNLAISERRRLHGTTPAPNETFEAAFDPVPARGSDPLLRKAIEGCREELPDKPAAALAARLAAAGAEADEALAARLGMRLNTFLQNFTRARRLLAACLRARGIDLAEEMT